MQQYVQQVDEAKVQSKMEKDKEDKERKEKDERKKKYEGMMKKVDEAEEHKKYQEALAHMPKEKDFPEYAVEINKNWKHSGRRTGNWLYCNRIDKRQKQTNDVSSKQP